MMVRLEAEVTLRPKNHLTLPGAIATHLGVEAGDRLILLALENGDHVQLRRVRRSYAGALQGVYGTPDEAAEYLRVERACWRA